MSISKQDVVDVNKIADDISYYVDQTTRSSELLTPDEKRTLWDARALLRDLAKRIDKVVS